MNVHPEIQLNSVALPSHYKQSFVFSYPTQNGL